MNTLFPMTRVLDAALNNYSPKWQDSDVRTTVTPRADILAGEREVKIMIDLRGGADTLNINSGASIRGNGQPKGDGGAGVDTFFFNKGADVITDFGNDRLRLDDKLWGNTTLTKAEVLDFATVVGADTVFDFGNGNTLTLENYTDIPGLESLLSIF